MTIRLCVDCRFAELVQTPTVRWVCAHPTSRNPPERSLVTGVLREAYQFNCLDMRSFDAWGGYCGREGRHWEPRE